MYKSKMYSDAVMHIMAKNMQKFPNLSPIQNNDRVGGGDYIQGAPLFFNSSFRMTF